MGVIISIISKSILKISKSVSVTNTYRLALNTMTLQVTSVNVNSGQGVAISVTGIAQVNITSSSYQQPLE